MPPTTTPPAELLPPGHVGHRRRSTCWPSRPGRSATWTATYCFFLAKFFTHVDKPMKFMAGALRTGRLAEDVIPWMARMDARSATPD